MALRISFLAAAAALPVTLYGCTSDLPAPGEFDSSGTTAGDTSGDAGDLMVDCALIPTGAVGATFDHTFTTMGGDGSYTWSAEGLPAGLTLDEATGQLSGTPTADGTSTISVTVVDGVFETGTTSCDVVINPQVVVDLGGDRALPCVVAGESASDFIVEGTGDGTEPACSVPGGRGNEDAPAGITVGQDCSMAGSVTEDRYGTYVWIVDVVQSGVTTKIPYCATKAEQDDGAYEIRVTHGGDDTTDKTLVPATGTFNPDGAFSFGGGDDPLFTVTGCTTNPCFFEYRYDFDATPFDSDSVTLDPDNRIDDDTAGTPLGFTHNLQASGPWDSAAFPDRFGDRTWVFGVDIDYCMAESTAECSDPAADGNGNLHFSVVMTPEP